jgi:hypothetical protein
MSGSFEVSENSVAVTGDLTESDWKTLAGLMNERRIASFQMTWRSAIGEVGLESLKSCEWLETVDLMGSDVGDELIAALRGNQQLRCLRTGRMVTDTGLAMLGEFPLLTDLLIDGPFTDAGLAVVARMDQIRELDLFWHCDGITCDGFAVLRGMPHLESLGCDGELSSDAAMRHIAAIPGLRKLRAQSSVASDAGFFALSRCLTLEKFWGRECPNLTDRGFLALSEMPRLAELGVSCKSLTDETIAKLPDFPALRQFTSIGIRDDGFRHVARCARLEDLSCMYCRDTTDKATEHIAGMRLRSYYAGMTRITDRSMEILSHMDSLESVELYRTPGVTESGLAHLARLPRLRQIKRTV